MKPYDLLYKSGHIIVQADFKADESQIKSKDFWLNLCLQGKAQFITNAFCIDETKTTRITHVQVTQKQKFDTLTIDIKNPKGVIYMYPCGSLNLVHDDGVFKAYPIEFYTVLPFEGNTATTSAQKRIIFQIKNDFKGEDCNYYSSKFDFNPNTDIDYYLKLRELKPNTVAP